MNRLSILLLPLLFSFEALALQLPINMRRTLPHPASFAETYDFEGIVSLSNCSGALIRFETSKETDQAMVLTNGHCLETGMPAPGTVVYSRPSSRSMRVMKANGQIAGTLQAQLVMYSTMTNTDMTIYQMKQTFAEIKDKWQVRALVLSSAHPTTETEIEVISGYWSRGYSCNIEAFIPQLKEDKWLCKDSIRYSRPGCDVIGGTSGSPIIHTQTREVIGVNNTGNEDGAKCTMNNPCEISEDGKQVTAYKGYSYGQQTYWVYSCLNDLNEIDLNKKDCLLPK